MCVRCSVLHGREVRGLVGQDGRKGRRGRGKGGGEKRWGGEGRRDIP